MNIAHRYSFCKLIVASCTHFCYITTSTWFTRDMDIGVQHECRLMFSVNFIQIHTHIHTFLPQIKVKKIQTKITLRTFCYTVSSFSIIHIEFIKHILLIRYSPVLWVIKWWMIYGTYTQGVHNLLRLTVEYTLYNSTKQTVLFVTIVKIQTTFLGDHRGGMNKIWME